MDVREAYNSWAVQYDENVNRTRDLEAIALRENLMAVHFDSCLEIGCGTGKNTKWLINRTKEVVAVDFSEEMLNRSKAKIDSDKVTFHLADIRQSWDFATKKFDLITFSLVLEHMDDLDSIFKKSSDSISAGGYLYLGELHPYKQYAGTKARFETEDGLQIVTCYNHHVSEFVLSAQKYGFELIDLKEYFDENDRNSLPRILTILFKKGND
jgi:ubiquinone/menaquinone biosynthesis C-methylase UbiE